MNTVAEYLKWMAAAVRSIGNDLNGYSCLEDFVLKHGRQFTRIGHMPKSYKMGRKKHCFMNAARLSIDAPSLTYVEGYAVSVIPMMHAWCVTKHGTVIDPTWDDGVDYYGVPIRKDYLLHSMSTSGVYGVIDLWKEKYPILKAKPKQFLQRL